MIEYLSDELISLIGDNLKYNYRLKCYLTLKKFNSISYNY